MEATDRANGASEMGKQYSLGRILGIWLWQPFRWVS
jgi:hypothetical protein